VQHTNSQDHRPDLGKNIADTAKREGGAHRFTELAGQQHIAGDRALITYDDQLLGDLELYLLQTAKPHDAPTRYRLPTVPGIGNLLSRVRLYDIHDIARFPRGQDFVSSGRRVTWAQASAGKRLGTAGQQLGNAHRKWAVSEAATRCLRPNEPGQKDRARVENTPDPGTALPILAHPWARAVYDRLKRKTVFDLDRFLQTSGSSAGAPGASLDAQGMRRHGARLGLVAGVCAR
jgi:Transposase IS116/IS110/IS902 family